MAAEFPAYANTEELEAFWRSLSDDETSRATTLLGMVSNYLRQVATNNSVDLDAKIENDPVLTDNVKMVVLSAVKRAIATPADAPPANQWSQSASPYSESMTFTNPSSDLYFKTSELALLGFSAVGGKSQFGILRGARGGNV